MTEEDLELYFQPFRGGFVEGTGLGLSLVAEHVRLHRGEVWVEERQGGGARFVVALPVLVEAQR